MVKDCSIVIYVVLLLGLIGILAHRLHETMEGFGEQVVTEDVLEEKINNTATWAVTVFN